MLDSLREAVTQQLSRIRPLTEEEQQQMLAQFSAQQEEAQQAAQQSAQQVQAEKEPAGEGGFVEDDPSTWGQPFPQREMSLRQWKEIQALPRPSGLKPVGTGIVPAIVMPE